MILLQFISSLSWHEVSDISWRCAEFQPSILGGIQNRRSKLVPTHLEDAPTDLPTNHKGISFLSAQQGILPNGCALYIDYVTSCILVTVPYHRPSTHRRVCPRSPASLCQDPSEAKPTASQICGPQNKLEEKMCYHVFLKQRLISLVLVI